MKKKLYVARVCLVKRFCVDVYVRAETPGDVRIIAEREARMEHLEMGAPEEKLEVERVLPAFVPPDAKAQVI